MAWIGPHHCKVLTSQLELQMGQAFADLKLRLQDGEVRTSRFLLASLSRSFSRMLVTDIKVWEEGVLTLEHICMEEWHCILKFYLSGNKLVTTDNVEDILVIAHLYQLEDLAEHCGQVLVDTLTSRNCCERLVLSYSRLPSASGDIFKFVKENLAGACQSKHFACLPKNDVLELLSEPGVVTTEEILCDAVLMWLKSNRVDEDTMVHMMELLKVEEMSEDYIHNTLMCHKQVKKNKKLQKYLAGEMEGRKEKQPKVHDWIPRTRWPKGTADDIIILGHDGKNSLSLYCERGSDEWMELPWKWSGKSIVAHKVDDVICVTSCGKATYMFRIHSKTWYFGPDLQERRQVPGMTSVGDCVFVVGGSSESGPLTSIEKHKIGSDAWEKTGDLQDPVYAPGVAAVGDVIIVAGGVNTPFLIQTFDVRSRTAVTQDTHLPSPMALVRGATLDWTSAVFLGGMGHLVQVCILDGRVVVTSLVQIADFGERVFYDLAVKDDQLLCFGGGEFGEAGTKVDRYNLKGEHKGTDNLPDLPRPMNVHAAIMAYVKDE